MLENLLNYLNNYNLFSKTLNISITIQIITGIIEFIVLFVSVSRKILFIKQLLIIEFVVQMVELIFYIWLFKNAHNINNITPNRYIDWSITTPIMLFTLIMYLIYEKYYKKQEEEYENENENISLYDTFKENKKTIFIILFLNLIMLIFGYLGETQTIGNTYYLALGFIPFVLYFWLIYINYAKKSTDFGKKLYYYFLIVWILYGIVAYFPYYLRNSCYNILDLFAKNFFGIYLSYIIIDEHTKKSDKNNTNKP
jgi:bacteriorhodopsin